MVDNPFPEDVKTTAFIGSGSLPNGVKVTSHQEDSRARTAGPATKDLFPASHNDRNQIRGEFSLGKLRAAMVIFG